ncbi:MAG: hypothetical protein Kow00120_23480 [Anaerolineae bacterium]
MEKTRALVILLFVGFLAVACTNGEGEQVAATETPTGPAATATLRAPTETPVPTSTPLTPSVTPTPTDTPPPSNTPPPSPTPTPTLTPTPQQVGTVNTTSRVNVRSGAGVEFEAVALLEPGDEVIVIGPDAENEDWVEIVLPQGSEAATGWVLSNLLDIEERVVGETPAPTTVTGGEAGETTLTPPAAATVFRGNEVYVLANCEEFNQGRREVTAGRPVVIHWGWVADTRDLIAEHVAHVNYQITLNDRPIGDWRQLTTRDLIEGGKPALYWYYYAGELPAGTYRIGYRVTWDAAINDGQEDFGPGTENESLEFGCTFVVQ